MLHNLQFLFFSFHILVICIWNNYAKLAKRVYLNSPQWYSNPNPSHQSGCQSMLLAPRSCGPRSSCIMSCLAMYQNPPRPDLSASTPLEVLWFSSLQCCTCGEFPSPWGHTPLHLHGLHCCFCSLTTLGLIPLEHLSTILYYQHYHHNDRIVLLVVMLFL